MAKARKVRLMDGMLASLLAVSPIQPEQWNMTPLLRQNIRSWPAMSRRFALMTNNCPGKSGTRLDKIILRRERTCQSGNNAISRAEFEIANIRYRPGRGTGLTQQNVPVACQEHRWISITWPTLDTFDLRESQLQGIQKKICGFPKIWDLPNHPKNSSCLQGIPWSTASPT